MYMLFFWRLSTFGYRSEACSFYKSWQGLNASQRGSAADQSTWYLDHRVPKDKEQKGLDSCALRKVCRRDWNVSGLGCGSAAADRRWPYRDDPVSYTVPRWAVQSGSHVPTYSNSCSVAVNYSIFRYTDTQIHKQNPFMLWFWASTRTFSIHSMIVAIYNVYHTLMKYINRIRHIVI